MKRSTRYTLLSIIAITILSLLGPSQAASQLFVTVSTDKQSYGPGELITISGKVLDNSQQGVAFASVSIQVNDPNQNPIHIASTISAADGSFTDQFTVPVGSADGGYVAFATASKPGYTDASNQAAYTVIPEFPAQSTLWLISIPLLLVALLMRRRKSGRELS